MESEILDGGRRRRVVLALAAWVGIAGCGPGPAPRDGWREGAHRWFDAEAMAGFDAAGRAVATITVSIPYRNLVFFEENGVYVARYALRAKQGDTEPALEADEWTSEVVLTSFAETREPRVERKTVRLDLRPELAQGDRPVPVEVSVSVARTQRRGSVVLEVNPRRPEENGLTLGELTLYALRDPLRPLVTDLVEVEAGRVPDLERFRRKEDPSWDRASGPPWVLLRVFDLAGDSTRTSFTLTLAVESLEMAGDLWSTTVEVQRRGLESAALARIPEEAIPFGRNQIRVSLPGAASQRIVVDNRGLDLRDDASWRVNLDQIEGLASREEMEVLREAPPDERPQRWQEFWARRDPDPEHPDHSRLIEHDRRVALARQRYADGFADGARSDRGRILILHGEPDTIETTSPQADVPDTYEVWRYFDLGLVYYFRKDLAGAYRLAGQERL